MPTCATNIGILQKIPAVSSVVPSIFQDYVLARCVFVLDTGVVASERMRTTESRLQKQEHHKACREVFSGS